VIAALQLLQESCGAATGAPIFWLAEFGVHTEAPGELLFFALTWMQQQPAHWASLTIDQLQNFCQIARWRPLLPDDMSQMLLNDIRAGLALHCIRALCGASSIVVSLLAQFSLVSLTFCSRANSPQPGAADSADDSYARLDRLRVATDGAGYAGGPGGRGTQPVSPLRKPPLLCDVCNPALD